MYNFWVCNHKLKKKIKKKFPPFCSSCFQIFLGLHFDTFPSRPPSPPSGGSEAICPGWPAVRWVSGHSLRGEVCALLLRQRHLSAVLLRVLLGSHPLSGWPWVPQAAGEGGRGPTATHLLPLELKLNRRGRDYEKNRAGVRGCEMKNKCTFLLS